MAESKKVTNRKNEVWKLHLQLFLFFLGGILLIAFLTKTFQVIKNSKYDGQNRFIIALANREDRKNILLFSIEPTNKNISLLNFFSDTDLGEGNRFRKNVQELVGAPVDGIVITSSKLKVESSKLLKDSLSIANVIALIRSGEFKNLGTNLTILDILKIFWDARAISLDRIEIGQLGASSSLFYDNKVIRERKTIEIINSTDIAGQASKIARILNNMGNPVLFIKTGDVKEAQSIIYVREESYTGEKLARILGMPISKLEARDTDIDIRIVIGEDY